MSFIRKLLLAVFICTFALTAKAVSFSATVNENEFAWNEVIELSLDIDGEKYQNLQMRFNTDDYKMISQNTSNHIEITGGQVKKTKKLIFGLLPKHPGDVVIAPISIDIDGENFTSEEIKVKVYGPDEMGTKKQNIKDSNRPIVALEVTKLNPYKHEQVLLKFKIYHRATIRGVNLPAMELDDFYKEALPDSKSYSEVINGLEYVVDEIDYILFPLKAGKIVIPAVTIEGSLVESPDYDPTDPLSVFASAFVVEKPIMVRSNELVLNVRDLPAGAPAGFTGYVGDLSMNTNIDKNKLKEGESLTLTTRVYGNGNFSFLNLDPVPKSSRYSVFADKDQVSSEIDKMVKFSQLTQKTAIVPNKAGRISLETKPIVSFNPILRKYETHGAKNFVVDVMKASGKMPRQTENKNGLSIPGLGNGKEPKPALDVNKEILHLSVEQVMHSKHSRVPTLYPLLVLLLINLIGFGPLLLTSVMRQFGILQDQKSSSFKLKLSELNKQIGESESLADVSVIIKDVIANLEREGLLNHSDAEFRERVDKFVEKCDQGNYGLVSITVDDLKDDGIKLLKELKKHSERKRR